MTLEEASTPGWKACVAHGWLAPEIRPLSRSMQNMRLKDFSTPIPESLLNIEEKIRSNLFAWRGQFSPQLIETLLSAYCPPDSIVLDSFAGSGTVLYEAAAMSLAAHGFELNPSAWSFCKLYEFANLPAKAREAPISELRNKIEEEFPFILFSDDEVPDRVVEEKAI